MRVKCVLCEKIDNLNDDDKLAKRLRNRPIHTYMCNECYERIEKRTIERKATGNFKLYEDQKKNEDW
ncbi:YlaI family protein [Bacillus solimangrovi]|uniref:DUF2197 domain-containing protein n=1 Tax=Bacillus solimangrovi TaxID=1305675 RepID=A0A1E5LIJ3_9BACI|nr:YlaI family protein [Bacillus solimangrovi]OEH93903.1 hypothetical protein BFG57_10560 [Bacillus solimangrovi]